MIFVYPYHSRAESDFEIKQSISFLKKVYPDAEIWTVGKAVPGINNLPCTQHNNIRGCDVTNRILTFAKKVGGEFIYMNKDFFITQSPTCHHFESGKKSALGILCTFH